MRPPLWVPACLLVGVLGFLAAVVARALQGPPAQLPSMLYPWSEPVMDWAWWSNANSLAGVGSFFVTFVGFVLAIYAVVVARNSLLIARDQLKHQLSEIQAEQTRMANEIDRRPRFVVRFAPESSTLRRVSVQDTPGDQQEWPIFAEIAVKNSGGRTARNVRVNIVVPEGMTVSGSQPSLTHPDESVLLVGPVESIHPDRYFPIHLDLRIRELNVEFELRVTVAYDDAPSVTETLRLGGYLTSDEARGEWTVRRIQRQFDLADLEQFDPSMVCPPPQVWRPRR